MAITVNVNGTILIGETGSSTQPSQYPLTGLSMLGASEAHVNPLTLGTSPLVYTLPISPVNFVFIENLSGAATVSVTWTPTGGTSAAICTLPSNSAIMLVSSGMGGGITALTLVASAIATPIVLTLVG